MDTVLLSIPAFIHLLPLVGVVGADRLEALYGARPASDPVLLAMRHRAVMFGVFGALLIGAILRPEVRPWAIGAVLAADVSFAALYALTPDPGPSMRRVLIADLVSIACLAAALL